MAKAPPPRSQTGCLARNHPPTPANPTTHRSVERPHGRLESYSRDFRRDFCRARGLRDFWRLLATFAGSGGVEQLEQGRKRAKIELFEAETARRRTGVGYRRPQLAL